MPIEVMDMPKMAREHGKRKVIFNTNRFHAWLHVYPQPGDADDMHCHNADQTFYPRSSYYAGEKKVST
jgi:hypothetical protein